MKKSAFSLIELSVVLIIITILVAAITQGSGLISSARIASARSATSRSPVPNIDGLLAWYEASTKDSIKSGELFDAAQISEWRDISPSSIPTQKNKLTKAAGINLVYRTNGINKFPSLQFSSSGKISLANFYQGSTTQATIFLVFKPEVAPNATAAIIFDAYSGQSTFSIGIKSTKVTLNATTATDNAGGSNQPSFTLGNSYILAAYFNGSSSTSYVNDAITSAGNGVVNPGSNSLTGVTIGTDKNGANAFTGTISEVIIYNRPLKLQERKDVMSYLSKKYKITVTGI